MTLLTASRKSFSVAIFLRALMANMPASVHTLRISAPGNKHIKVLFSKKCCIDFHGANISDSCFWKSRKKKKKKKNVWLTSAIGTQASQQLKANIPLHTHGASMDLKYVCASLERENERPNVHHTKQLQKSDL